MAQRNEIFASNIASLQVVANDNWQSPLPIITLDGINGDEKVNISFDELSHLYHRYSYIIEHCEADWSPSKELIESDYMEGFASGNTIDEYEQSVNTNTQYTHYSLTIPNDRCRPKMSGNYMVTIIDEEDNAQILKACFLVTEQTMKSEMTQTSNTDIDINKSHQQIGMKLNFGSNRVTSPNTQIKTVVLQNGRWDNAVKNAQPQYVKTDGLVWDHNRKLIFPGGNEYRKFETLDPTHPTMGIERVSWDGNAYHAWTFTDEPRPNYLYDEDADGVFCIRNSDNVENDTESEYILTHFTLKTSRQPGEVFINGSMTQDRFDNKFRMTWNENDGLYEAVAPLKQGYYNYQYLTRNVDGSVTLLPSEGSFYQTENSYQLLVYFRGQGERTDRLVNYLNLSSRQL
jgi:hypothetical protein